MTRTPSPPLRNIRKLSSPKRKTALSGSKNMTGYIEAELYIPATEDTPEKVLSSDRVKVTSSLFVMGDHTDYGQLLKPELNTNYMWDCDLANNTYKTPKSGGDKYKDGKKDDSGSGESYLESVLSYGNGFTMDFGYAFDHSYGDDYGYVQAAGQDQKLSFVGNGGVKFGSKAGRASGVFEAAILDVNAWVSRSKIEKNNANDEPSILHEWTNNQTTIQGAVKVKNYAIEALNCLMNGVGYGRSYDLLFPGDNEIDRADYWALLEKNLEISSRANTMTIVAEPVISPYYGKIQISTSHRDEEGNKTNVESMYSSGNALLPLPQNTKGANIFDGKIYLQAHWGSGVIYQNVSIEPKKSSTEGEEA